MGLKNSALWEVQWHPGGRGRFRRLVLTWRGLRRIAILLVILLLGLLAAIGVLPLGVKGFFTRFTVEAAREANQRLRGEQERLRDQAEILATVTVVRLQRARRFAWLAALSAVAWRAPVIPPPAKDPGDDAMLAWLNDATARLEGLGLNVSSASGSPVTSWENLPTAAPLDLGHAVPVTLIGWRVSPFTHKSAPHHGITLAAHSGEPVLAPGRGRVVFAGSVRERRANEWTRFGNVVVLDHGGGVLTVFGHLGDLGVRRGQAVKRGQRLGTVGQSGWTKVPALYYEVRWPLDGGSRPIDPGLVTLMLPVEDLDEHLTNPTAGLPDDYAQLSHLVGGGERESGRRRR